MWNEVQFAKDKVFAGNQKLFNEIGKVITIRLELGTTSSKKIDYTKTVHQSRPFKNDGFVRVN
jgi:hypothetical protein